uniref:Erythroferrone n=1 Tax=Chelydra serpentina TaxID=8475 RepID=A0A8C3S968_CHESE
YKIGTSGHPTPGSQVPHVLHAVSREPLPEQTRSINPRDAWMLFMKQSNKGVNSRKQGKGKSKKFKFGLPGPPGPPSPPGPPGALVTPEELLKDFRLLLKGTVVKERERMSLKTCDGCQKGEDEEERGEDDILALVAGPLAKSKPQHRVEAAFHCRIRRNISIERRSLQELRIYYIVSGRGSLPCWTGKNANSATLTHFLNLFHGEQQMKGQQRARDRLRVLICVQSLCQHNISLETVAGLDSSELFTISVSGVLYLQAGQYTSVFVDNATGSSLTVRSGSDFSAVLLGV